MIMTMMMTMMNTTMMMIMSHDCDHDEARKAHHNHQLCFFLVAHGDDSQHQVDEVEGAEEDDDREEDHVDRATRRHHLGSAVGSANLIPAWRSSMRLDALFCFLANPPICEELL